MSAIFNVLYFDNSYDLNFQNGPPIRCEKYTVSLDLCDNFGITEVTMPTIWSAPDQAYASHLIATVGKAVSSN